MTRTSKKDREFRIVEIWRTVEPACPPGELAASERPDFLLSSPKGLLGIEITEMLVPTREALPQIAREQYQDHAVSLARRLHLESGGPPLDVAVLFGMGTPVTKRTVHSVAKAILALVVANTPADGQYEWKNEGLEHPELAIVRTYRSPAYNQRTWHTWHTGWVPVGESSWIQDVMNKKASLSYKLPLSDVWLVIVTESSRASSVAIFGEDVIVNEYATRFGRAFLLDSTRRVSTELRIRPSGS